MASPFGHAAVGAASAAVVARSLETPLSFSFWVVAIVAAGAPDLDLLLAWFGKAGPKYHRNASHSIVVLGAGIIATWWVLKIFFNTEHFGLFWAGSVSLLTHPVLDVLTTGPKLAQRGYGIGIFWPLSRRRFSVSRPMVRTPELDTCNSVSEVIVELKPEVIKLGPPALVILLAAILL